MNPSNGQTEKTINLPEGGGARRMLMKGVVGTIFLLLFLAGCTTAGEDGKELDSVAEGTRSGDSGPTVEDGLGDQTGDLSEDGETAAADSPAPEDLFVLKPCLQDAECNDLDPCTTDKGVADYGCANVPKDCSDSDECTTDSCSPADGKCLHGPIDCADDNECTIESCEATTGCIVKPIDCGDGFACTADGCSPKTGCTHKPLDCDDSDPCTDDSCSEPGGCKHSPVADPNCCVADFQCNDELPCTLDQCVKNSCVFSPIAGLTCCAKDEECVDANECTENKCIEGLCQLFAAGPGCCMAAQDCEDKDGCTTDTCIDHFCKHEGLPGCCHKDSDCDDEEICTTDLCQLAGIDFGFCENKAVLGCCHGDDEECDDGNLCTADTCPGMGKICEHAKTPNCCLAAADCDDLEMCTDDLCTDNECEHVNICCASDKDCDDGDDVCTADKCVDKFCFYAPTGAPGCCNAPLFEDDFSKDAGWTFGTNWQRGPAKVSSGQSYAGPDPGFDFTDSPDNYVAGVILGGNAPVDKLHDYYYATSPVINAAGTGGKLRLVFRRWLNSDYEPYMANIVEVFNGTAWMQIWKTEGPPNVADSAWTYVALDVGPYANAQFRVRFGYKIGNNGVFTVSSWNIDDVKVYAPDKGALCCEWGSDCKTDEFPFAACQAGLCLAGECADDPQCDDGNDCTTDSCEDQSCVNDWIPGCCVDSLTCTQLPDECHKAACVAGQCVYSLKKDCCLQDSECDDGNVCTDDECVGTFCFNTGVPDCCTDAVQCDDGTDCTSDSCTNNECVHEQLDQPGCCLSTEECTDLPTPCHKATCYNHECHYSLDPADGCLDANTCDDGDNCTEDLCENGCCKWVEIPGCCTKDEQCDDGKPCSIDTCNPETNLCEHTQC
jgi:hypothetical protein